MLFLLPVTNDFLWVWFSVNVSLHGLLVGILVIMYCLWVSGLFSKYPVSRRNFGFGSVCVLGLFELSDEMLRED